MFEIIDNRGEVVAESDTLRGARTGVSTLLHEGYDVLAIDAPDGSRVYTTWLDDDGREFSVSDDSTRGLRAVA